MKLSVANRGTKPISSWQALLVGQKAGSKKVVFREPVSDTGKPLEPGRKRTISFYWEQSEELYDILLGASPAELRLNLYKVEILK